MVPEKEVLSQKENRMNRSGLCIKMLQILYGNSKPISRIELAKLLDTNVRNIAEFKKELEIAGYHILSTSGKYGGYVLDEKSIFPALNLEIKEVEAVNEALNYLEVKQDFLSYADFKQAIDKMKSTTKNRNVSNDTMYLNAVNTHYSEETKLMIHTIQYAKEKSQTISFMYTSLSSEQTRIRKVQPYAIIMNESGAYLLGYDISENKEKMYKIFKIIESRMSEIHLLEHKYNKDKAFKIEDYIGQSGLFKDLHEVKMEVYGKQAIWLNEKQLNNVIEKTYTKQKLYLHFMMEGKYRLLSFILSLGSECKVLYPQSLQVEIKSELLKALQRY